MQHITRGAGCQLAEAARGAIDHLLLLEVRDNNTGWSE